MTATIFALSSGRPPAGIAVVRVSGPAAFATLVKLTLRPIAAPRLFVRRRLIDPHDATVLDEALVVAFPSPASVTGDDVVELHLHGGNAVVAAVLKALGSMSELELATPGAFTRRAFDNGKLDLSQVEALADLIDAGTEVQRRQALDHAGGLLRSRIAAWRATLIEVRADLEASLDFADEDEVPAELTRDGRNRLRILLEQLSEAAIDARRGERVRDGLTVAVTGPVNAGKSSLINAIAQRNVAIVTDVPGTTRDVLEVRLDLGGVAVMLLDTAGLRETNDPVEIEGIRRAVERANSADLVIDMGNVGAVGPNALRVSSKSDLGQVEPGLRNEIFHLSAATRDGIDDLLDWLSAWASRMVQSGEPALIVRERHRVAVLSAEKDVASALTSRDAVIVAEHLRSATGYLDSIVGTVTTDDVLDAIFSRFCLGK